MDDPREERGHELASVSANTGVPQQPYAELHHSPSHPQVTRRSPPRPQTSSTLDKEGDETFSGSRPGGPLPLLPQARLAGSDGRMPQLQPVDSHLSGGPRSGIDWIVPLNEKLPPRRSVGERLQPTLDTAIVEKNKYAVKARMTGYALNAAIGLQVIISSLITGLSASLQNAGITTTILGGLNTLVAAYLARARGSNEPELSITRVKDLEQFIRECQAFQMDYGHVVTGEYDERLIEFRRRFEELLGNANGERKLSPV